MDDLGPATRFANSLSEFINIVWVVSSLPDWHRYCLTTPAAARKQTMLRELSDFIAARTLLELPDVRGPKDWARRALDAAPELATLITEWDGEGDPSAAMTAWASEFKAGFAMSSDANAAPHRE